jgi:hypothetical protein
VVVFGACFLLMFLLPAAREQRRGVGQRPTIG